MKNSILKAALLIVLVSLCVGVPLVIFFMQTDLSTTENMEGDGTVSWTSPTTDELYSVFMVRPDDGWAVGLHKTIIHWNGTTWNNWTTPTKYVAYPTLYSVFMTSADDGWTVGSGGTILHWNGTTWTNVASPIDAIFNSVFMIGANDGWATRTNSTRPSVVTGTKSFCTS